MYASSPQGASNRETPRQRNLSTSFIHSYTRGTTRNIPTLRVAAARAASTHASSRSFRTLIAHKLPAESARKRLSVYAAFKKNVVGKKAKGRKSREIKGPHTERASLEIGPPKSSAKDLMSSGYRGKKAGETSSGGV